MPKFSIIIPVYNVEAYLRECLDSVLAQTCADWEAICVNDGSTDGSLAILQEYASKEPRVHIIDQPNKGLSAARNAGIHAAKGEYIFLLDSDDWIVQDALKRLNKHIAGQDMICFSGQRYFETNHSYNPTDQLIPATYTSGMEYYSANALLTRDFQFVCAVLRLYRREYLLNHKLFFTDGIYHEDNMFTPLACYYANRVTVIPDSLYIYRIRPHSIMTTFAPKHMSDMAFIANELAAFFLSRDDVDSTIPYRAISQYYQNALSRSTKLVRRYVLPVMNWHLYYRVSRTKIRHRFNFLKYRIKYMVVRP